MPTLRSRLGTQFDFISTALEDRSTPAVTVAAADGLLTITGDDGANRIDVVDLGKDGVSVALDGAAAKTYANVAKIAVLAGAGDDKVSVSLRDGAPGERGVRVELGAGNDQFLFRLIPSPAPEGGDAKTAPGTGGDAKTPPTTSGGDTKSGGVVAQPGSTGSTAATSKTSTPATSGGTSKAGDSKTTTTTTTPATGGSKASNSKSTTTTGDSKTVASAISVTVLGGDGNDVITAIEAPPEAATGKPTPGVFKSDFKFVADGGTGDDKLSNTLAGGTVLGKYGFVLAGGVGNDTVGLVFHGVVVNCPLAVKADGGAGNDIVKVAFDPPAPTDASKSGDAKTGTTTPTTGSKTGDAKTTTTAGTTTTDTKAKDTTAPAPTGSVLNGPVEIVAVGGEGNDAVEVLLGAPPPADAKTDTASTGSPTGTTKSATTTTPTADAKTGPGTIVNGLVTFTVDGGAGNDKLAVGVFAKLSDKASVGGKLLGGAGDDEIKATLPPGQPATRVCIDGGEGKDAGFVTGPATVTNVETVVTGKTDAKTPPTTGGDSKTPPTTGGTSKAPTTTGGDSKAPPTTGGTAGTSGGTGKAPTTGGTTGGTTTGGSGTFVGAGKK